MNFRTITSVLPLLLAPIAFAGDQTVSAEGKACLESHRDSTPGIVEQWQSSAHAKAGVDCYSCHKANDSDPATFDHYGHKIAVIVTPNCSGRCHSAEVAQFGKSHHAARRVVGGAERPQFSAERACSSRFVIPPGSGA